MARRVASYFIFVGIVLLAIAFVLAMGEQPSGRMLLAALGCLALGVWLALRAANAAPAPPPVQAKEGGPAGPAQSQKPAAPGKPQAKPRGLAALLLPKSKSKP